ncbi:unnamed protein product [Durusdinium trenchii]|uniref:Pentatricopeptide repeat-containing protein, chloroplastic n=1 Tax=Durusdinium trenchii TaxID=1381693 RepID=A0ABP0KMN6_9DINO
MTTRKAVTTFARCRKELTKATELLKEIKAGRLQQHEVGVAISSCAKSTRWPEAVELLRAVPLPNVVIYNATINACAKAQQWALAVQLLREMPERRLSPNVVSFSTAMSACRSQWQRCLQLLEALCEEAKPNSISFNAAINACVGRWQVTLQLLHEMDSRLMDPNLISFTGAMGACTTGSQWPKALSLFRQLRQWKHLPDLISWNAAMAAAEAGAKWQLIIQLWKEMTMAPNNISFTSAIAACEAASQWRNACDFLRLRSCFFTYVKTSIGTMGALAETGHGARWHWRPQRWRRLEQLHQGRRLATSPGDSAADATMAGAGRHVGRL